MAISLDEGSLARMLDGAEEKPTVQILGVRKMNQKGPQERYRMIISDGLNSINFAMLGTQLNPRVESGDFSEFTIVKLAHSITSKIKDKNGICK
jgi:Replication factor-A protein 1, N-terminal domain